MTARTVVLGCTVFPLLFVAGCAQTGSGTGAASHRQTPLPATVTAPVVPTCDAASEWRPPADNVALNDLALVTPNEGWVVGSTAPDPSRTPQPPSLTGLIYHLVQGQLMRLSQTYPGAPLMTVAMDSPADGWAASTSALIGTGDRVLILHYHLGQWRPVDIPALDAVLKGPPWSAGGSVIGSISVQMFGPDAGWMFAWTNIRRDPNNPASRSEVVILRYVQGVWTPIAAPAVAPTTELSALSAVSADEAWIVGTDYGGPLTTLFAHYVNGSWSLWPQTFPGVTERLAMFSPTDGWALANTGRPTLVLHYDGTAWTPVPLPAAWATQGVGLSSRIFPTSASATWFGAYSLPATLLVEEYANGDWQQVAWPYSDVFPQALAASSATELWGIGDIPHMVGCGSGHIWDVEQGVLLHFQQGRWTGQLLP